MKGYPNHFQSAAAISNIAATIPKAAQETVILLAAEQILAPADTQIIKNEQNAIIRLATSIKKYGILEPLAVKLSTQNSGFPVYELVDGERRYRAAGIVGMVKIPCIVLPPSDSKCLQMAEIAHLKQENPHYFVLAEAFLRLMTEYHMTQEDIARKMRLSQSAVANKLRLLRLTPEERRALCSSSLTERHARALLRIYDPIHRLEIIRLLEQNSMTVAELEQAIEEYRTKKDKPQENNADAIATDEGTPFATKQAARVLPLQGQKSAQIGISASSEGLCPSSHDENLETAQNTATTKRVSASSGVVPRKFAMRDLQPLYNSIERTLGIFEKTGVCAEYHKEENESAAHITIYIPKRG